MNKSEKKKTKKKKLTSKVMYGFPVDVLNLVNRWMDLQKGLGIPFVAFVAADA